MEKITIIPMAADHAGFELKEYLKQELVKMNYEIKDYGTFSNDSVDYPDMIHPIAKDVNTGMYSKAIVICGTGNGVQMVANKYENIRCALCWKKEIAELAVQHNNANIMALPARFVEKEEAMAIVKTFLVSTFEGDRHLRRIKKIPIK